MWFWYLLIALFAFRIGVWIACINMPRAPLTPGDAIWIFITHSLLIWGVVYYGILQ